MLKQLHRFTGLERFTGHLEKRLDLFSPDAPFTALGPEPNPRDWFGSGPLLRRVH